jgi:anaerobic ribonucleoside-triphosphate reductase activating protein
MNKNAYIVRICTSFIDIPDKIAVAVYFSGCSIRCKGCQNADLWERDVNTLTSLDDVLTKIQENSLAERVVFLGGEPTDQMDSLIELCKKLSQYKALYTGREFEVLPKELIDSLDMIVCGPFRQELFVKELFPASTNQRYFKKIEGAWVLQKPTSMP